MGIIGRIIRTLIEDNIREIVIEEYQGLTKKLRQVSPAGIDSNPLPEDQGAGFCVGDTTGKSVAVGVYCENCIAESGEIRFFSRDDTGAEKSYIYPKKDGTLELNGNLDFAVKYSALETAYNELQQKFNSHTHPYVNVVTPANTSATGTPSVGAILLAKVLKVKI